MQKYIDVILPLPVAGFFTYSLPREYEDTAQTGSRVIVPFGQKKYYTAIIVCVHNNRPQGYEVKNIIEVLDSYPLLLPTQLKLWNWVADYYLCTPGDVYKAALPSGLKLESETQVIFNPDFEKEELISKNEQQILDILSHKQEMSVVQLGKESKTKNILPLIKSLLDKQAIRIKEELRRSYKPKTEVRVKLTDKVSQEDDLKNIFNDLSRAPKQLVLLMGYIELAGYETEKSALREVGKKELLEKTNTNASILNNLIEKGIFEIYEEEIGRLNKAQTSTVEINTLNPSQQTAYNNIVESFKEKNVCLLHGVTSAGKTEIYIHLIQKALQEGKQVLYLLPEIALTTQITERLKRIFGNRLGIYHSKFPDAERVEIWQKQLSEERYDIILGVRSSVFLPFRNLGLVIVDEEHENTYKQQDPAPRYHARNTAIVLAGMYNAKVLLGTATPSIESYHNAISGKYGFVELKDRYKDIQLPEIVAVDIKELHRKKRMNGQFSPQLIARITEALEQKEQVILFQNRRGFAPMIECKICGWVPRCVNCDISLTYHKAINQLTCHYCGYTYPVPHSCPACESMELINRGFGTEKVEEDVKTLFPHATVARMDLDTTRTRVAYEKIITDFETRKVDILIGTQMVSKGLDFEHVRIVGILNADSMLNFPDFRAYERSYQLMAQVSGRAGRKNRRGLVILQTKSPDNPIIHQVISNDYEGMYLSQLAERQLFKYPPFFRFIYIYIKSRKEDLVNEMAIEMAERLRIVFGNRILGPDNPLVKRVQTLFIKKIVIKIEMEASMSKVREQLTHIRREMMEDTRFKSIILYYDVDPM